MVLDPGREESNESAWTVTPLAAGSIRRPVRALRLDTLLRFAAWLLPALALAELVVAMLHR